MHRVEPEEKAVDKPIKSQTRTYRNKREVELVENSIDRIMLWHVLEHIPRLKETVGKIKHWLKKDGGSSDSGSKSQIMGRQVL